MLHPDLLITTRSQLCLSPILRPNRTHTIFITPKSSFIAAQNDDTARGLAGASAAPPPHQWQPPPRGSQLQLQLRHVRRAPLLQTRPPRPFCIQSPALLSQPPFPQHLLPTSRQRAWPRRRDRLIAAAAAPQLASACAPALKSAAAPAAAAAAAAAVEEEDDDDDDVVVSRVTETSLPDLPRKCDVRRVTCDVCRVTCDV